MPLAHTSDRAQGPVGLGGDRPGHAATGHAQGRGTRACQAQGRCLGDRSAVPTVRNRVPTLGGSLTRSTWGRK